jgi:uncharacterized protein YlxP (DUF503 family)
MIHKLDFTNYKVLALKVILGLALLALILGACSALYAKREVLTYAFLNETKVKWLIVASEKAQLDADTKVKESLSTLFISE